MRSHRWLAVGCCLGACGGDGSAQKPNETDAGRSADAGQAGTGEPGGDAGSPGAFSEGGGSGTDDGVEVDEEAPRVTALSPQDGSVDVDRDAHITIQLSEPVEITGVPAALHVLGPDGPIAGSITVEQDSIRFEPSSKLDLLGEYVIELEPTLTDWSGNRLESSLRASFRVRDGLWAVRDAPVETETPLSVQISAGNTAGDLFIGGNDGASPPTAWGAVYDSAKRTWTEARRLVGDERLTAILRAAALGEGGVLSVAWWLGSPGSPGGWQRYARGSFAEGPAVARPFQQLTAVSRDNRAMLVAQDQSRSVRVAIWEPDRAVARAELERDDYDETLHALLAVENDFVLIASQSPEAGHHQLSAIRYLDQRGFQAPEQIASSSEEPVSVLAKADDLGNLVILWNQGPDLWARRYSPVQGGWQASERIATGPSSNWKALAASGGFAVASYQTQGTSFVAIYAPERGWLLDDTVSVGSADGIALTMDPRGNALAVWNRSGRLLRYVSGVGWQSPSSLELISRTDSLGCFSARDGSIALVFSDQSSEPERPAILGFE